MTNPSKTGPSLADLRGRAAAALTPFFEEGPGGQVDGAREAAEGMLDEYKALTPKELQLSAQIIALNWASLACLSAAMTVRDKSLEEMMDLQDAAIKLDKASQKTRKALDARRKERGSNPRTMAVESMSWDEGAFQLAMNQALDKFIEASAKVKAFMAGMAPAKSQAAKPKPKLPILLAEPMTSSILSWRAKK